MTRLLFVEASTGGVVGGSLSGLYHLIRGMDRERFRVGMALYEAKSIENDLVTLGVDLHHVHRARLPKEHSLLHRQGYQRAKKIGPVRSGLWLGRQTARLLAEELPTALSLARLLRREKPHVVHLGNGLRANFDGFLACHLTRTPVVCHVKGFEKYSGRERWASRRLDVMVCMTQAILRHCKGHGLAPPVSRVVYDALDEEWFRSGKDRAAVRSELGVPVDAPLVGILGNIQAWKGQAVLVEALGQLAEAFPRLHCLIVGGTHRAGQAYERDLRRRVRELGLEEKVHFTGFRDDVPDILQALDVVVHASVRPEPFGRVILEGMASGKPVVATLAGGVPEIIENGKTGWLVPPGDVSALAACLRRILSEPAEANAIARAGEAWAHSRFSLARQVSEMCEIYDRAVKNGRL